MRFYLDENFSGAIAQRLTNLGHEVFLAVDLHPEGTEDAVLLKDAQDRAAIFLSTDKDFFHTIALRFRPLTAPVVSFTLCQPSREQLWSRTLDLLEMLESEPNLKEILLVKDTRIVRHK